MLQRTFLKKISSTDKYFKDISRNLKSRDKFKFQHSSLKSYFFSRFSPYTDTCKIQFCSLCDIHTVVLSDNKYNGRLNRKIKSDSAFTTLSA